MRLIDADKAIEATWEQPTYTDPLNVLTEVRDRIRELPTVDAVPVRHGKWLFEYEVEDGRALRCSECRMVFWVGNGRDGNFCPNCGAKMDREE